MTWCYIIRLWGLFLKRVETLFFSLAQALPPPSTLTEL